MSVGSLHIQPITVSQPLAWLAGLTRRMLIDVERLPAEPVIFLVSHTFAGFMAAAYTQALDAARHSLGDWLIALADAGSPESVRQALQVGQTQGVPLVPVGIAAAPTVSLPGITGGKLPLPRSRIVVCFETPFHVPERPVDIPAAWVEAVLHSLGRAEGRSKDSLATWQRDKS